jgi:hypothetical protein
MTQALPGTPPMFGRTLPPAPRTPKPAGEAKPQFNPIAAAEKYSRCPHPASAGLQPIVEQRVNEQNTATPILGKKG